MPENEKYRDDLKDEMSKIAAQLRERLNATNRQATKATRVCIDQDMVSRVIQILESEVPSILFHSKLSDSLPKRRQCASHRRCEHYIPLSSGEKCPQCGRLKTRL